MTPAAGANAVQPDLFDPFPADRVETPERPLPKVGFDAKAHAFAVVEAVNRARTDPPAYAAALEAQLAGCYSGVTFTPPWGGRLKTEEGEANLLELLQQLRAMSPKPALRLLNPLSEAAQQLGEEVAASAEGRGKHNTSLEERLKSRGKWAGAGGEAVVYSVRQPDAMVAMLLLGDGDATRRNRTFLLRDDLKVAGVGLADHAKLDSVGVLTLVSMFAINLPEATSVECQGDVTPAFQDVLDAIPSEQVTCPPRSLVSAPCLVRRLYLVVRPCHRDRHPPPTPHPHPHPHPHPPSPPHQQPPHHSSRPPPHPASPVLAGARHCDRRSGQGQEGPAGLRAHRRLDHRHGARRLQARQPPQVGLRRRVRPRRRRSWLGRGGSLRTPGFRRPGWLVGCGEGEDAPSMLRAR